MNHDGGGPYWKLYHNSNISKLWKNSTFIYACIKFKYLFESGPCIWYKAEDNKFNLIHLQLAKTWSENVTVHWPARTTERAQRLTSARAEHEIGTTPRDVVGVRHCVRHSGRHIRPQSGRGAWAGQSPSLLCQCVPQCWWWTPFVVRFILSYTVASVVQRGLSEPAAWMLMLRRRPVFSKPVESRLPSVGLS